MLNDHRMKVSISFRSPLMRMVGGKMVNYGMRDGSLIYYVADALNARQVGRVLQDLPAGTELQRIEVTSE